MTSSDFYPETEHRDIGLGVTFFRHTYRSSEDRRLYYHFTHVPVLGYCPGCSPQAHENLKSTSSSGTPLSPNLFDSISPAFMTDTSDEFTECDIMYDYPEDGVLVNAETYHAGPSYTKDGEEVGENEERRIEMVQFMLERWRRVEGARKRKKFEERKRMEQGKERREEMERWRGMRHRLDGGRERVLMKMVGGEKEGSSGDGLVSVEENEVYWNMRGGDVDVKDSLTRPAPVTSIQQSYTALTTTFPPNNSTNKRGGDEDVETTGSRKHMGADDPAISHKFRYDDYNHHSAQATTNVNARENQWRLDLGLVAYESDCDHEYDENEYEYNDDDYAGAHVETIVISDED